MIGRLLAERYYLPQSQEQSSRRNPRITIQETRGKEQLMTRATNSQKHKRMTRRNSALPNWDLSDLYDGMFDPRIEHDLCRSRRDSVIFAKRYRGKLARSGGKRLSEAISQYEKISELLSRVGCYAQLLYSANTGDAEVSGFYQTINEQATAISSEILFFELEINRLPAKTLARQLTAPAARRYRPWIEACRNFRHYQLDDDLERLLNEKQVAGRAAWVRLFDETMAGLRFKIGKRNLTEGEVLDRMSNRDRNVRRTAAKAFGKGLEVNIRTFALITNTLAKDKAIDDEWRGFGRPVSRRNLGNRVEDEVVDALVTAVKASFPRLSHRYYRLKSKWLDLPKLEYWDRNAPLPEDRGGRIVWSEARRIVLDAYGGFEPCLADLADRFFKSNWIDAAPRPGKASGAFSHPGVPSVHPYILMNFHGQTRDVMTLAHELGHGIHQLLAGPQGHLMSDTPLILAETASVFGEMLTFRSMLERETDPARRRIMLAGKIEDMLNTVVRQVAFHDFESRIHDERAAGEISTERLGEIWMDIQKQSLGPAFHFDAEYRHYWAYIPHFIHSPFYVYAYAFGDCLVNSLYDVYQNGDPDFSNKYMIMLAAGGTKQHRALLKPFGLDAADPGFWQRGLGVISGFIDELQFSLRMARG